MLRYLLRRALEVPPTLLVASVLVFALMHVAPGDPVANALGPLALPETVRAIRAEFGLDLPLPIQYGRWLYGVLRGDLGKSILTREPVLTMLAARAAATAWLALAAATLFVVISFPAGVLAASRRHTALDRAGVALTTVGLGLPSFFLAVLLIAFFGLRLRWLPIAGYVDPLVDPGGALRHLVLPVITLSTFYVALTTRLVRASVLDALSEPYVRTARAKGIGESIVLARHALRNGLIPATTAAAINVAYLLGGAIVVEEIFAIPGIGRLLFVAVTNRDFPVIQGIALVSSLTFVACSFAADVMIARLDPRLEVS